MSSVLLSVSIAFEMRPNAIRPPLSSFSDATSSDAASPAFGAITILAGMARRRCAIASAMSCGEAEEFVCVTVPTELRMRYKITASFPGFRGLMV